MRSTLLAQVAEPQYQSKPCHYIRCECGSKMDRESVICRRCYRLKLRTPPDFNEYRIDGISCMRLPLLRGLYAIVNSSRYEELSVRRWDVFPNATRDDFYAYASLFAERRIGQLFLHRVIFGSIDPPFCVDHRDHRTLNDTIENLRRATRSQSLMNQRIGRRNTSGYKGVWQNKRRWNAEIKANGKKVRLGSFSSKEGAARAYDEAAILYHGEFAVLNFPPPDLSEMAKVYPILTGTCLNFPKEKV